MQEQTESNEDPPSPNQVLVTGASGLVGRELTTQLLDKGYLVRAMVHSSPLTLVHPMLSIQPCDILDPSALEEVMTGVTHVYHCAAVVSFDPGDRRRLNKINVEGTENVVNACIQAKVQKLVHVSSVSALGRIRNGETVTEEMTWSEETGKSVYGKSKYLGEMEVWRGIGEGLEAVIVNPSIILGGTDWEVGSTALFKSAYEEFKYYTEGISGFVDVKDVARAMIMLMNSKISRERFILSAENLSYRQIFSMMARCFDKNPPYKKATPALSSFIWKVAAVRRMLTGKKQLLTKETARTAQSSVNYDAAKILKALPEFQFSPIADTIKHSCTILQEKYHL